MDADAVWRIFVAAIGFGAAGEGVRRYRAFKTRRWRLPASERNAGFWTDRRIIRTEAALTALIVAAPFSVAILLLGTNGLWHAYAGLVAYAVCVFVIMLGFRPEPPQ